MKLDAGKTVGQQLPTATAGLPGQAPEGSAAPNAGAGTDTGNPSQVFDSPAPSEAPVASEAPAENPAEPAAPESSPPPSEPLPSPTVNPEFTSVQFPGAAERWRYVQVNRAPLEGVQTYTTPSKQLLWWYDPVFGQPVKLGEIQGDFPVQATFRFRGQEVEAVEVPYQVNQSFGITLPAAVVERIKRAGGGEWIEAFVYKTDDIRPR
ncbi:MAG TPA: hypothetical protein VFZ66_17025 [Herpetosiphonaceae bacterium]